MAEFQSPGVFVEELPAQVQVVQSVSTSNMGIVGFTPRGPANVATLVTSFDEYLRKFGGFDSRTYTPVNAAAFFANGGRRAYVVRVVPQDAVAADCRIQSQTTDQQLVLGDGYTTTLTGSAGASVLKDYDGASSIVPGSLTVKWRTATVAVSATNAKARNGSSNVPLVDGQTAYEARVDPSSLTNAYDGGVLIDSEMDSIVRGTVVVSWNPDGGSTRTIAVPPGGASSIVTTTPNSEGSVVTFDHRTGIFSVVFAGADIPNGSAIGNVQVAYFPTSATLTATTETSVDSSTGRMGVLGSGLTSGGGVTNSCYVDVEDGSWSLSFTTAPHSKCRVLVSYKINACQLTPSAPGACGNNLRVDIRGNVDYFTPTTQSFSRYDVNILLRENATSAFEVKEHFEELSFSDATDAKYFADVLNELSDLVTVTEPAGLEAPGELSGFVKTFVLGGGTQSTGNKTFSTSLNSSLGKRSLVISYYDESSTLRTIRDDGNGNLIGAVSGTATVDYSTGDLTFVTSHLIKAGTLVSASFATSAAETVHRELFGDSSKSYSVTIGSVTTDYFAAGSDGTFASGTYGRSQFTAEGLQLDYSGVYALSKIDEIMQVCVPDFAGDETISGDLLTYAASRAAQPSGGDRFIILTTPKGSSAEQAVDWFRNRLATFSDYAALYWPWVKVSDPLNAGRQLTVPPLGHIAGVYARTDTTRNVGKAPGGTVDGALRYVTGLEFDNISQGDRDTVSPNKINALISSPQTGIAVWGVRTISNQSQWRYINARRLFMFLEKSIYNATFWIVFENNGPALWSRIKSQVNGFMASLFAEGYFKGNSPEQAFKVVCDETNNSAASQELGQVIIDVGASPNRPAEFVRFRFQQMTLEG